MLLIKGFHVIWVLFVCVENPRRSSAHKMPHKASRTDGQTDKLKTIFPVRGIIKQRRKPGVWGTWNKLHWNRFCYITISAKNYCKLDNPDTHVYTLVELYDIQLRDVCLRYQYKYDQQAEQVSCRILDGCHKSLNTNTPKFAHRFFISAL